MDRKRQRLDQISDKTNSCIRILNSKISQASERIQFLNTELGNGVDLSRYDQAIFEERTILISYI